MRSALFRTMYHLSKGIKMDKKYDAKRTPQDFNNSFNGLLTWAKLSDVDTTNENNMAFIRAVAEVIAEDQATIRHLYNIIHKKDFS